MTTFILASIIIFVALGVKKVKLKWSLNELKKYPNETLSFSDTVDLKESLMVRDSELLDVSPIHIDGMLALDDEEVILHMNVSLSVTLPSARSLKPVDYPLTFSIDETYVPAALFDSIEKGEEEVVLPLKFDWIDLKESIEDAVLLHLPIQAFTEEEEKGREMPSGKDWAVISEEEYALLEKEKAKEKVDPRLAGLQNFFAEDSNEK